MKLETKIVRSRIRGLESGERIRREG
jgi:hypothetical protein